MQSYFDIVKKILDVGERRPNRTGVDTIAIAGSMFEHDMKDGFPLLTTKKMSLKNIAIELEFFIKGLTDKRWLQERNNHIWDEWATPAKAPYGHDKDSKQKMLEERDLGPIYGFQWRHYNAEYFGIGNDYAGQGVDQLKNLVESLKKDPNSRRMIVNAWNPQALNQMALPPCHYSFQITVINGKLNLLWNQRSVDTMLGLPYNIASYGLLLHLMAKEASLQEGKLIGLLGDVHIYENHFDGAKEQLLRTPKQLPLIRTNNFSNIFEWSATDSEIINYDSWPKINFEIAV